MLTISTYSRYDLLFDRLLNTCSKLTAGIKECGCGLQGISNVSLVDLSAVHRLEYKSDVSIGGYAIKAFAIIYSSFAEVLCLDSDNLPVHDPSALFDTAPYKENGNLFWSDPNINGLDALVFQMFGLQPPWEANEAFLAAESGQILLNR